MDTASTPLSIKVFGGPTASLRLGGVHLVTDPTFDAPGEYPLGPDLTAVKTSRSTVTAAALAPVDVVLLSHDLHPDNLDNSGRASLSDAAMVLTTVAGADRLRESVPGVRGMNPWDTVDVARPDGGTLTVTAVPALHGPQGSAEVTGDVIGFVLRGENLPTVYISGDNASLEVVREVANAFPSVDVAVLFAGAARIPVLFDGALVTIDSAQAATAAQILGARTVVPVHYEGWTHFSEGRDDLEAAFLAAGIADRLDFALA